MRLPWHAQKHSDSDLETRSGEDPPTPMTPEVKPGGTRPAWLARSGVELEKVVAGGGR